MTTIVTRAYKDLDTAKSVMEALRAEGHPDRDMDLFNKGDGNLSEKLADAKVPAESVPAFVKAVESGKPVVVARAEITPFGAAARAKNVLDSYNPVKVQDTDGDFYVSVVPLDGTPDAVDTTHGRFFTSVEDIRAMRDWSFTRRMGWRYFSDRKPSEGAVYRGTKFFTDSYFPLLSDRKPSEGLVYHGRKLFTEGYWRMLSDRKPSSDLVMKDHPYMSKKVVDAPLLTDRRR